MKKIIKKHRKKIIVIAVIIIVVFIVGVIASKVFAGKKNGEKTIKRENTVTLSKMNLTTSVSATGTINSAKSKNISSESNGVKVSKVNVQVGDTVKKGDVILTFDKSDLQEALEEANENLTEAKSEASKSISKAGKQLSEAKSDYSSQKTKLAKKTAEAKSDLSSIKSQISTIKKKINKSKNGQTKTQLEEQLTKLQEQLTQAQSAYEQAVENEENTNKQNSNSIDNASDSVEDAETNGNKTIKEAENKVKEAKENLEKCTVKATMSGVVTVLNVEAGDTYSGGTIAQIDDTSSFTVTTSVDEYDISKLEKGQKVIILTEATDEDELEGEITFISPSTNSSSTQSDNMQSSDSSSGYEVKINIKTADDRLRMGLTAKCSIVLSEATDVFAVPYDAIHEDADGNTVIYVKDQTANNVENTTGASDNKENQQTAQKEVKVTKGMESDYYVEISGDDLQEGMQVIIPSDETTASDDKNDSDDFSSMFGGKAPSGDMPGGNSQGGNPGGGNSRGGGPAMGN